MTSGYTEIASINVVLQTTKVARAYAEGFAAAVAGHKLHDCYPITAKATYRRAFGDGYHDATTGGRFGACGPASVVLG